MKPLKSVLKSAGYIQNGERHLKKHLINIFKQNPEILTHIRLTTSASRAAMVKYLLVRVLEGNLVIRSATPLGLSASE